MGVELLQRISPLMRKLRHFGALTDTDLAYLARVVGRRRTFKAGQEIIHEGQVNTSPFILSKGWAISHKVTSDGQRQITGIHVPGDFLGMRSALLRASDHNVEAATAVEAAELVFGDMFEAFHMAPGLAGAILWAVSRDGAILAENLVNLGRRSSEERVACFLLDLGARLRLVGIGGRTGFECPLTQRHLGDALGLSAIHVNRVLRKLREEGLVTFQNGYVGFDDFDGLVALAGFNSDYLDHRYPLQRSGDVTRAHFPTILASGWIKPDET